MPVDGLRRLGVNSGMRCPMQTEKRAAVRTNEIESKTKVFASVEFVVRAALHDWVEDDFVHSIAGRIIAERENRGEAIKRSLPNCYVDWKVTCSLPSNYSLNNWKEIL